MLKFVGKGFLPGYPMYDLDETEYGDEEIEILLKSGLYERVEVYRPEEEIHPIKPKRVREKKPVKGVKSEEREE